MLALGFLLGMLAQVGHSQHAQHNGSQTTPATTEKILEAMLDEAPTMREARRNEIALRKKTVELCKKAGLDRCYNEYSPSQTVTGKPVYVLVCRINGLWRTTNCPTR